MNSGTDQAAQVEARVSEHLTPGESFRAAVWASRADSRAGTGMSKAELSPFRFRRPVTETPRGARGTHAAALDTHLRNVTEPRVLALTDRRVLVLSKGSTSWRDAFRRASGPVPELHLRWECPRADLESSTHEAGRLRLTFTDASTLTLLTPASGVQPFLAG